MNLEALKEELEAAGYAATEIEIDVQGRSRVFSASRASDVLFACDDGTIGITVVLPRGWDVLDILGKYTPRKSVFAVNLEALKEELEAAGYKSRVQETTVNLPACVWVESPKVRVDADGQVNVWTLVLDMNLIDIIRKYIPRD